MVESLNSDGAIRVTFGWALEDIAVGYWGWCGYKCM